MPQAEANVVSQNFLVSTSRKEIRWCNRFGQGSGAGLLRAGAWGPGPQGLGARAPAGLGARAQSLGPRPKLNDAMGFGGKRARDTPPTPPPPTPPPPAFLGCKGERKRVFTLSVTETIQHAPQGRRIETTSPNLTLSDGLRSKRSRLV